MQHDILVWVGIDWATEEHQVCGVDEQSKTLFEGKVKHTGDDIEAFIERLLEHAGGAAERIAVAIETPHGSIVEALIERGIAAFSINPKQLDRFRDRHTVGGAKCDRLDAFVLADSLRTDLRLYRRIELGDPVLVELRDMVRAREAMVADEIALGSRLREQIHRYYPQVLKLGSIYVDRWIHALLELAPTPAQAARLSRAKVVSLLRRHRVRRLTPEEVLETLREKPLVVAPGVVEAASAHVRLLLPLLRSHWEQLAECDGRIEELMTRVGRSPEVDVSTRPDPAAGNGSGPARQHRDADILLSVPGLGVLTSATMLAEASTALRDRDYQMPERRPALRR